MTSRRTGFIIVVSSPQCLHVLQLCGDVQFLKVKEDKEEDVRVCSFKLCVQHLGQSLTVVLRVGPVCDEY